MRFILLIAGALLLAPSDAHACFTGTPEVFCGGGDRETVKPPSRASYSPETGIASWYGGGEKLNRHTANGEVFNPNAMTAAHRTLPFGARVRVVNLSTGKSVTVRINDRGPAGWTGRSIDLSRAAASALGFLSAGTARVSVRRL